MNNMHTYLLEKKSIFVLISFVILICAWSNLGAGLRMLELSNSSILSVINTFRAAMPYLLPFVLLPLFLTRISMHSLRNPVTWLLIYGFVSLFSSIFSLNPYVSLYFGSAFIMNLIVPYIFFSKNQLLKGTADQNLLIATWIIFLMIVITIVYTLGNTLFTGYGIANAIDNATRSSGLSRWLGVTVLILLPLLIHSKSRLAWLYIIPIFFCCYFVWTLQSRGGTISLLFSLCFISFIHKPSRKYLFLAIFIILLVAISVSPESFYNFIYDYIRRGQDSSSFESLSGRTRAWSNALEIIYQNFFFGSGHRSDRILIGEHVHNAPLQAAMNGGIVGFLPYFISWILGLYLILKIKKRYIRFATIDKVLYLQAATIYIFFTFRSITETTFASFSADSLIVVPIMLFLFSLEKRTRKIFYNYN